MIESDEEAPQAWDESPAMPPEGDPSYSPAIHGARSHEHLRQLLREGKESGFIENFSMEKVVAEAQTRFEAVGMEEHALENMGEAEQVAKDYDEAWSKEIRRRRETLASGEAKTVSFAELSARIEKYRP